MRACAAAAVLGACVWNGQACGRREPPPGLRQHTPPQAHPPCPPTYHPPLHCQQTGSGRASAGACCSGSWPRSFCVSEGPGGSRGSASWACSAGRGSHTSLAASGCPPPAGWRSPAGWRYLVQAPSVCGQCFCLPPARPPTHPTCSGSPLPSVFLPGLFSFFAFTILFQASISMLFVLGNRGRDAQVAGRGLPGTDPPTHQLAVCACGLPP